MGSASGQSLLRPGDLIADRYELQRPLGVGGMGVVFAARDVRLERDVAIKFLKPEDMESTELRARFIREAKAAGSLRNESAVAIFDTGLHPPNTPFIVMERLEGEDLASLLRRQKRLPVDEAVDIVIQACGVLSEAHALGIVHRDIKPPNLFVTTRTDGTRLVKVLDFGLAKAMKDAQLTQSLVAMGSPRYMSPEQVRSVRDVDGRTDVWSIAIVLYEMLAGSPPFVGFNVPAVSAAIVTEDPKPLSTIVPEVPEALSDVVLRALKKRVDERIPSIDELVRELRPFGSPEGSRRQYQSSVVVTPVSGSDLAYDSTRIDGTLHASSLDQSTVKMSRSRMFLAGTVSVAIGATIAGMAFTRNHAERDVVPATAAVSSEVGVVAPPPPRPSADDSPPPPTPSAVAATPSASPSSSTAPSEAPPKPSVSSRRTRRQPSTTSAQGSAPAPRPEPASQPMPSPPVLSDQPPGRDRP